MGLEAGTSAGRLGGCLFLLGSLLESLISANTGPPHSLQVRQVLATGIALNLESEAGSSPSPGTSLRLPAQWG